MREKDFLLPLALLLSSCAPTPDIAPTATATSTARPLTATPTSSPTAITISAPPPDYQIRLRVEQAKKDEVVEINNGLIGRVGRVPWVGGEAYFATLREGSESSTRAAAVLTQADCVFDALRAENRLGTQSSGSWVPNQRVDYMRMSVSIPASSLEPVPVADLLEIRSREKKYDCRQITAGDQFKAALKRVNWREIPEDVGNIIGNTARGLLDGLRRGFGN